MAVVGSTTGCKGAEVLAVIDDDVSPRIWWLPVATIIEEDFCWELDGKEEVLAVLAGETLESDEIMQTSGTFLVSVVDPGLLFSRELIVRYMVWLAWSVFSFISVCTIIVVDVGSDKRSADAGTDLSLVILLFAVLGDKEESLSSPADPVQGSISPYTPLSACLLDVQGTELKEQVGLLFFSPPSPSLFRRRNLRKDLRLGRFSVPYNQPCTSYTHQPSKIYVAFFCG